jgi:asparagine synthase (glutamine-hydrolysing)
MFAVDAETQLPDDLLLLTDKMSMAVSLECRVPLLDHELVELAAPCRLRSRSRVGASST